MADVIAIVLLADVIANYVVADVIAIMLLVGFNIVGREEHNLSRLIKESVYIRVNNPSLNKNIGKYHLPHVWDEVLVNTTALTMK